MSVSLRDGLAPTHEPLATHPTPESTARHLCRRSSQEQIDRLHLFVKLVQPVAPSSMGTFLLTQLIFSGSLLCIVLSVVNAHISDRLRAEAVKNHMASQPAWSQPEHFKMQLHPGNMPSRGDRTRRSLFCLALK